MRWCRRLVILALFLALVAPAPAGWIFNRKPAPKPEPMQRVPELIQTLKNDGDESKRQSAAEELRQYDPNLFPAMIPALVEALMHDSKPSVRAEAAQTLGSLRPISQQAGKALEQAVSNDSAMRVRIQARSSLVGYRMAGYRSAGQEEPVINQTQEPPLAPPLPPPVVKTDVKTPPIVTTPGRLAPTPAPMTKEPPTAKAPPSPIVPTEAPKLETPPATTEGPELAPPPF